MRKGASSSYAMVALVPAAAWAQETKAAPAAESRAKVTAAAREIMGAQQFCAFIAVDEKGLAQVTGALTGRSRSRTTRT